MTKGIVHIGVEKTGSTSVQFTLARNRRILASQGVLYPMAFGERNHVKAYAYAFEGPMDDLTSQWNLSDKAAVEEFRLDLEQRLSEEVDKFDPHVICVSNEHCSSRLLRRQEIERISDVMGRFCDDIRVVIYLRRQGDALRSAYSTYVKTGGIRPFSMPTPAEIERKYDYNAIIARWSDIFGKENIDARVYDEEHLVGGDVVADFVSYLGMDEAGLTIEERSNTSLGAKGIEFLRRFNRYVPYIADGHYNQIRGNIHGIIENSDFDVPFEGNLEIIERFDEAMRASNERVRELYFSDKAGPLFAPPEKNENVDTNMDGIGGEGERRTGTLTGEDMMRFFAMLWELKQKQVVQLREKLEARQGQGRGQAERRNARGRPNGARLEA